MKTLVFAFICLFLTTSHAQSWNVASRDSFKFILRPDSSGDWYILNNSTHRPSHDGFTVTTYQNRIVVGFGGMSFDFIETFTCHQDSVLTKKGYLVGDPSGGNGSVEIYINKIGSPFDQNPHNFTSSEFAFANINCRIDGGWYN